MAGWVVPRLMGGGWGCFDLQPRAGTALPTEVFWALVAVVASKALLRELRASSLASHPLCSLGTLLMGCASLSMASMQVLVTLTGGSPLRLLEGLAGFWVLAAVLGPWQVVPRLVLMGCASAASLW